jgi:hypothetical protein
VNEAEGRSQWDASSPSKLARDMGRASLNDESMHFLEEGEIPSLEKKFDVDVQAEADAAAQAAMDAEVDARCAAMAGMSHQQMDAYVKSQMDALMNQNVGEPAQAPVDEKQQVNALMAQAGYVDFYPTPTASPGKRKAANLGVPQADLAVKQVAVVRKQDVEAQIRQMEAQFGSDLSEKTIAAEQAKQNTLLNRTIPRKFIELRIELERKVEYESKKRIWDRVLYLRACANASNRVDPKLNAPYSSPNMPKSPQERATIKLRKAQEKARALGVQC